MSGVNRPGDFNSKINFVTTDSDDEMAQDGGASLDVVVTKWRNQVGLENSDVEAREPDIEMQGAGSSRENPVVQFLHGQMDTSEEASSPTGPITRGQSRKGKGPVLEEPKRACLTGKRLRDKENELTEYNSPLKARKEDPKTEIVPSVSTQVYVYLDLPEGAESNLIGLLQKFLSSLSIIETDNRIKEMKGILARLESLGVAELSENSQLEVICFKAWCLLEIGKVTDSKKILNELQDKINSSPFALFVQGRLSECTHKKTAAVNFYNQSLAFVRERQALPKDTFTREESILHVEGLENLVQSRLCNIDQNTNSLWKIPSNENTLQAQLRALVSFGSSSSSIMPQKVDEVLKKYEEIIEKHPKCVDAYEFYSEFLLKEKSEDTVSMTRCLTVLRYVMEQRPKKIKPKMDYIALIHKVQLARFHVGTHPEGSLREVVKNIGHQVLELSPGHVEAIRLLSVQYRIEGDYQTANALVNGSFISLVSRIINIVFKLSDEAAKKISEVLDAIPYVLNEDLEKHFEKSLYAAGFKIDNLEDYEKKDMLVYANILYLIQKGEETVLLTQFLNSLFSPLPDSQKVNLSEWITFILGDKAFIELKKLEDHLEVQKGEGLLENSNFDKERRDVERLFNIALHIYPKHSSAYYGLGLLCKYFGDTEGELRYLKESYNIQPTDAVLNRLKSLGEMGSVDPTGVDEKPD